MQIDLPEGAVEPGPAHWYWLGGRPALDLVNTRRERWRRSIDCLVTASDVVEWLVRAGLLEARCAPPRGLLSQARQLREAIDAGVTWLVRAGLLAQGMRAPASILGEARALREAIDAGVRAAVAGEAPDPTAIALVDEWLAFAGGRAQLGMGPDGQPQLGERGAGDSPRRALGLVALDAAQLLGSPGERSRLRICASETCSARFYDRSPAGRRRWCSMQQCGNVEKARRHRARAAVPGESR
jgi:predicted RNA-binding Zn ribbon-like protein